MTETQRLIEARYGQEQLYLARHCLRSVTERLRHAPYHYKEARCLLKAHIDDRLEIEDIDTLTWASEPKARVALNDGLMKVEAHIIASAQAVHSIADTLAHVVYYAVGLNLLPNPLGEREVSIHKVREKLTSIAPDYAEIEHTLSGLHTDSAFAYIDAIVNHSKHRGFPESCLSIEPPDRDAPYAMEFGAFAYKGAPHFRREIEEVLAPGYGAAARAVVDTGNAINNVLSKQQQLKGSK